MNSDGTGKRRLTWFNRPGHPESVPSPIAAGDSSWDPDGSGFLAYIITDQFGNAGPLAFISAVAPAATVSAASFRGSGLAPESIVSLFSRNLSESAAGAVSIPLPAILGATQVRITDSTGFIETVPLVYVSPAQINYILPSRIALGQAFIEVLREDAVVAAGTVLIAQVAPGIFSANQNGQGPAAGEAVLVRGDGTRTTQFLSRCGSGGCVPLPIDTGSPSDSVVLVLYGVGIRGRSSLDSVRATVGGLPAQILYAGDQGAFVGLDQVNIQVPPGLSGAGEVRVVLTIDGIAANTVEVAFR
jgi:uncharacterized protein (TIGR03437 family)